LFRLCAEISKLDDGEFVAAVRHIEHANPLWLNLTPWRDLVRRDIDMRMLLK